MPRANRFPLVLLPRRRAASATATVSDRIGSSIVHSTETETVHKVYKLLKNGAARAEPRRTGTALYVA